MSTPKTVAAPRKRHAPVKLGEANDTRAEMAEVMKKLHTVETELAALIERSLCGTLHATGDVAKDVRGTVRNLLGSAFDTTREVSKNLLDAGLRTAETSRAAAHDAAITVQDFGRIANEAVRQVMRGAAEGLAEIRSSHADH